jgi:hypothetical protein
MTRSNLIRGGKRFPDITPDLRETEDLSALGTATDSCENLEDTMSANAATSTWSNSVALFFGDAIASTEALGREEWSHTGKLKNDLRTIGTLRRVSNIDEPLINVLRGDMSLVGPSPVVQQELREHFNFAQKGLLL